MSKNLEDTIVDPHRIPITIAPEAREVFSKICTDIADQRGITVRELLEPALWRDPPAGAPEVSSEP